MSYLSSSSSSSSFSSCSSCYCSCVVSGPTQEDGEDGEDEEDGDDHTMLGSCKESLHSEEVQETPSPSSGSEHIATRARSSRITHVSHGPVRPLTSAGGGSSLQIVTFILVTTQSSFQYSLNLGSSFLPKGTSACGLENTEIKLPAFCLEVDRSTPRANFLTFRPAQSSSVTCLDSAPAPRPQSLIHLLCSTESISLSLTSASRVLHRGFTRETRLITGPTQSPVAPTL
ncbi:unnamed protein product [Pleuronectes platessa]|uniref:Uncharacterized protein n=1 Tax=Pleuronectes platessa TaxID=8262 RepID=A0A9N7UWZ7_PLEPL|nr:unnamed protein product [Pleuronectes platessa]